MGERLRIRVIIERDEDGIYVAQCPTLPGCVSQGRTREEALENVRDSIKGYLESLKKHGEPIPEVEEDAVEVFAQGFSSVPPRYT